MNKHIFPFVTSISYFFSSRFDNHLFHIDLVSNLEPVDEHKFHHVSIVSTGRLYIYLHEKP